MRKKLMVWTVAGLCVCMTNLYCEEGSNEKPTEEVEEELMHDEEEVADRNSEERDQRSLYLQNQENVRRRMEMRYNRWKRAQRRQQELSERRGS
ncbi:hypothetical protein [Parachlamydia sp. AcF125]|uniref:hypothetical protein n=1 Tax=Parachlamydia sp. AcF125 TaxID=2795736 RepID=UPI001BC9E739|nr:hypothetical protein [Parachlamydia sp. AcF125]MBS4168032.1 hypothetical protein [Parachlamydia sp. AcF125]